MRGLPSTRQQVSLAALRLATGDYSPACNGFLNTPDAAGNLAYRRFAPQRNSYPTEQLTIQSNYFRRVDFSARGSYSSSEAKVDSLSEAFRGLITRTRGRQLDITGNAKGKRVVANSDLGVTVHLTDKVRLVDTFRFSNFRIPGFYDQVTATLFGATLLSNPNTFDPATCPPPFTAATCPQHNASSGADIIVDQMNTFLRQDLKLNTFGVEYDLTRYLTAHLGYRYEHREIAHNFADSQDQTFYPTLANRGNCAGQPLVNGVCSVTVTDSETNLIPISARSALFGLSLRPVDAFRLTFDTELMSADRVSTRISPRQLQHYKLRAAFKPKDWINLSGTMNVLESRNNVTDVLHKDHNRNYGFALSMNPKPRFGSDIGYDYNDIFSTTNICYVATPAPPGSADCGTPFLSGISVYKDKIHSGYLNLTVKPLHRVTTNLGYNLTSTSGETLILDRTQGTLGPLAFNYHKPFASVCHRSGQRLDLEHGLGILRLQREDQRWRPGSARLPQQPGYALPSLLFLIASAALWAAGRPPILLSWRTSKNPPFRVPCDSDHPSA